MLPQRLSENSILAIVEGLYCKRPVQCLESYEMVAPHPLTARRVCTPRLWCGGRTRTCWVERGWGVNISEDARHWIGLLQYNPSVLYICKYFVLAINRLSFIQVKTDLVQSTKVAFNIHVSIFEAIVSFVIFFLHIRYTVTGEVEFKNTQRIFLVFTKYSLCSCSLIDAKIIAT